ncbi:hypothetical protein DMX09_23865 [Pseudomonas protegens]|uniref:Uncharacterized protein n=1 Tax=Pseudomonas protegens TaxID=380021 RepID=A0A9Q6IF06_9PSED|nr:hypothetical protein DMX09_23865 [Pseudomonas protegens]PYC33899.1 hypothetical protein DMX08_19580 [Pseudomonas protegens]ROL86538.1 hypothetical protein BK639_28465 [Pseudomonas protegens]ROL95123.1 hypothetical protein BK640_28970 [Pseudomonas protegens]ROL97887.1 hypothetical protein BK641_27130 [Pseudomonas protegens]
MFMEVFLDIESIRKDRSKSQKSWHAASRFIDQILTLQWDTTDSGLEISTSIANGVRPVHMTSPSMNR